METLNLRVYRRTLENIALLWNKKALDDDQLKNILITVDVDGTAKPIKYKTAEQVGNTIEEGIVAPGDTTVMLLNHEQNHLDPYSDYELTLSFGTNDKKKIHKIFVYSFGVLPPLEKDDKKINRHMYGWVEEERKWAKVPLVKSGDGYAIPVKLVKD